MHLMTQIRTTILKTQRLLKISEKLRTHRDKVKLGNSIWRLNCHFHFLHPITIFILFCSKWWKYKCGSKFLFLVLSSSIFSHAVDEIRFLVMLFKYYLIDELEENRGFHTITHRLKIDNNTHYAEKRPITQSGRPMRASLTSVNFTSLTSKKRIFWRLTDIKKENFFDASNKNICILFYLF